MKPRFTKDFARAVSKIRSEISEQQCADAVGRSRSLIRKWADPDHPSVPNLEQALMLDLIYARSTGKKPLILEFYTEKLTDALSGRKKLTVNLTIATLSVQSIVGQLSRIVADVSDGVDNNNLPLSNYNRSIILTLIDELQELSDLIEDTVEEDAIVENV